MSAAVSNRRRPRTLVFSHVGAGDDVQRGPRARGAEWTREFPPESRACQQDVKPETWEITVGRHDDDDEGPVLRTKNSTARKREKRRRNPYGRTRGLFFVFCLFFVLFFFFTTPCHVGVVHEGVLVKTLYGTQRVPFLF